MIWTLIFLTAGTTSAYPIQDLNKYPTAMACAIAEREIQERDPRIDAVCHEKGKDFIRDFHPYISPQYKQQVKLCSAVCRFMQDQKI